MELEEGSFVIVRYLRKKAPYHFVGKVLQKAAEDENSWLIHYYKCCFDVSSSHLSFKQPKNPDISATDRESIIKILPKPSFAKGKLCFKTKDIGDLVMH